MRIFQKFHENFDENIKIYYTDFENNIILITHVFHDKVFIIEPVSSTLIGSDKPLLTSMKIFQVQ